MTSLPAPSRAAFTFASINLTGNAQTVDLARVPDSRCNADLMGRIANIRQHGRAVLHCSTYDQIAAPGPLVSEPAPDAVFTRAWG
jgi:hypothetical protein